MEHMNIHLRHLAEFDGWIFSASGNTAQKGRNGTARRLTDLHYHDRWDWIIPAYSKLCAMCDVEHKGHLQAINGAISLDDKELAAELCGKLAEAIKSNTAPCQK